MPSRAPDLLTPLLAPLAATSPSQAGVLVQAVRDLALAVEWAELRPLVLPGTDWVAVVGRKRKSDPLRAVLPLPLHTTALTPQQLGIIFRSLSLVDASWLPDPLPPLAPSVQELRDIKERRRAEREGRDAEAEAEAEAEVEAGVVEEEPESPTENTEFDPDTLYVAIGTTDSTVVYYKLARGIRKPADIPDE